eukprot:m.268211 g.268211  ORF g.268211 m.268211 type:complete len:803 (+) comp26801_c1_seq1:148-2556(+)
MARSYSMPRFHVLHCSSRSTTQPAHPWKAYTMPIWVLLALGVVVSGGGQFQGTGVHEHAGTAAILDHRWAPTEGPTDVNSTESSKSSDSSGTHVTPRPLASRVVRSGPGLPTPIRSTHTARVTTGGGAHTRSVLHPVLPSHPPPPPTAVAAAGHGHVHRRQGTAVPTAAPARLSLVANGDFETGYVGRPWLQVESGAGTLPGWNVTLGNVDFGNYDRSGHCDATPWRSCAAHGDAFIDMCGGGASSRGSIQQRLRTQAGRQYALLFSMEAHVTCTGNGTPHAVRVQVTPSGSGGADVVNAVVSHTNDRVWGNNWTGHAVNFTSPAGSDTLSFTALTTGGVCGCALLDWIRVYDISTAAPTASPTVLLTAGPTNRPSTRSPTSPPTATPTAHPTTVSPTAAPSVGPSAAPTASPSDTPTVDGAAAGNRGSQSAASSDGGAGAGTVVVVVACLLVCLVVGVVLWYKNRASKRTAGPVGIVNPVYDAAEPASHPSHVYDAGHPDYAVGHSRAALGSGLPRHDMAYDLPIAADVITLASYDQPLARDHTRMVEGQVYEIQANADAEYATVDQPATAIYSAESSAPRIVSRALKSTDDGAFGSAEAVQAWIDANVDRATADAALTAGDYAVGAYCLRKGSDCAHVLCVRRPRATVAHFRITKTGGRFCLDSPGRAGETFASIHELLGHFSTHRVSANIAQLTGCIRRPPAVEAYSTPASLTPALTPTGDPMYVTSSGTGTIYAVPLESDDDAVYSGFAEVDADYSTPGAIGADAIAHTSELHYATPSSVGGPQTRHDTVGPAAQSAA